MNYLRIISFCLLACLSFLLPLHLTVIAFIFLSAVFVRFWEGVLVGVFLDCVFPSPVFFNEHHLGFFTVSFVAALLALEWVRHLIQGKNILCTLIIFCSGLSVFYLIFFLFN